MATRRRAHGVGSIKRIGSNSFRIRYELPRDENGKRRRASENVRAATDREAERILRQRITAAESGGYIAPTNESVSEFFDRWFEIYVRANVSARTEDGYRSKITAHALPAFGDVELQKLTAPMIQRLYSQMLDRGLSERSVLHVHRILRQALGHAVTWGQLRTNPALAVTPPRPKQRQVQMWTAIDSARFLSIAVGHQYEEFYRLLLLTGLRRSEALGLRWSEVNLPAKSLQVVRTLQPVRGKGLLEGQPKTARSRRNVSLSSNTVELLHSIRGRQIAQRDEIGDGWHATADWVFTKPCGCVISPEEATRRFAKLVKANGLTKITLHGLRHAHATMMLAKGVHPKIVSERLGHASVSITLDTYSHVSPSLQADAAELVDQALAD